MAARGLMKNIGAPDAPCARQNALRRTKASGSSSSTPSHSAALKRAHRESIRGIGIVSRGFRRIGVPRPKGDAWCWRAAPFPAHQLRSKTIIIGGGITVIRPRTSVNRNSTFSCQRP